MENEEILEVIENEGYLGVMEEDSSMRENSISDNASILDSEYYNIPDTVIADALRSFIETYSSSSGDSSSDLEEGVEGNRDSSSLEISQEIDYTQLLTDLYDAISDSADADSSYYEYVQELESYNKLDSDINDISLENTLLIMLIGVILFLAVIVLGRRSD